MTTRAQWLRNKAQHDQRPMVDGKPRVKKDAAEDTTWMPDLLERLREDGGPFKVDSAVVRYLGNADERERRLRELARRGHLSMRAVRIDVAGRSVFSHYEWELDGYQPDPAYAQTARRVKDSL